MARDVPLSTLFGLQAEEVDLSRGLDDAAFADIEAAFRRGGGPVFRNQRLDPAGFHVFARRVGRPEPHVIDPFHHPEPAEILIPSNVKRDGRPIGLADGGTCFHTDYSSLQEPAQATIMWDNLSMLHSATLTDPDDPRTPWRITVEPPNGLPA